MKGKPARKAVQKASKRRRASKADSLEIVYLPIAKLKPDPANARVHGEENLDAIRASIDANGVYQPILVQAKSLKIIAGHGRLEVMKERGLELVPCIKLRVGDAKAHAIAIADNRSAELAEWDGEKLQAMLDEIEAELEIVPFDLGFTPEDLEAIVGVEEEDEEDDDDHTPAATQFKVVVVTKDEKDQASLLKSLRRRGYKCHAMSS